MSELTYEVVLELLRKRIREFGTARAYAAHIGASPVVISQIVNKHKMPTGKILSDLGLTKKTVKAVRYERTGQCQTFP